MLSRIGTCYNPCSNISEDELNEKSDYLAGHVNCELHMSNQEKTKACTRRSAASWVRYFQVRSYVDQVSRAA